jgi:hypothetical protein
VGAVDEEGGGVLEEGFEEGVGGFGEVGLFERGFHEVDPGVAGGVIDGEGVVAHAEAGVAAGFDVVVGSAEAEDEEVAESEACGFHVGAAIRLFVHGAEDGVGGDLAVEGGGEAVEAFEADLLVDVGFGVVHLHFQFQISGFEEMGEGEL